MPDLQSARTWQDYKANLILNYLGGSVGIGTKNATHLNNFKLAVKGKILCEGLEVITILYLRQTTFLKATTNYLRFRKLKVLLK